MYFEYQNPDFFIRCPSSCDFILNSLPLAVFPCCDIPSLLSDPVLFPEAYSQGFTFMFSISLLHPQSQTEEGMMTLYFVG